LSALHGHHSISLHLSGNSKVLETAEEKKENEQTSMPSDVSDPKDHHEETAIYEEPDPSKNEVPMETKISDVV
jgi:hypothetical protein